MVNEIERVMHDHLEMQILFISYCVAGVKDPLSLIFKTNFVYLKNYFNIHVCLSKRSYFICLFVFLFEFVEWKIHILNSENNRTHYDRLVSRWLRVLDLSLTELFKKWNFCANNTVLVTFKWRTVTWGFKWSYLYSSNAGHPSIEDKRQVSLMRA